MSKAAQAVADLLLYEAAYKRRHGTEVRCVLVGDDRYELHKGSGEDVKVCKGPYSLARLRHATWFLDGRKGPEPEVPTSDYTNA